MPSVLRELNSARFTLKQQFDKIVVSIHSAPLSSSGYHGTTLYHCAAQESKSFAKMSNCSFNTKKAIQHEKNGNNLRHQQSVLHRSALLQCNMRANDIHARYTYLQGLTGMFLSRNDNYDVLQSSRKTDVWNCSENINFGVKIKKDLQKKLPNRLLLDHHYVI